MPNKYIRPGATFNGDGTAPNAATSNGGVGAWNDLGIFRGSDPPAGSSLGAGDVVYIRSKDQSGADIAPITLTANQNLGSTAASVTNPITWVLDDGTVWPGANGTLKFTSSGTAWISAVRNYNVIESKVRGNLQFENTSTAPGDGVYLLELGLGAHVIGPRLEYTAVPNGYGGRAVFARLKNGAILERPVVKVRSMSSFTSDASSVFIGPGGRGKYTVIDPDIELTQALGTWAGVVYLDNVWNYDWNVIGGRLYGVGATTGKEIVNCPNGNATGMARFVGFQYPRSMSAVRGGLFVLTEFAPVVSLIGSDGGMGGTIVDRWGWVTSRTDQNPPYLDAALPYLATALPDSVGTNWSWRLYAPNADHQYPAMVTATKLYTGAPGVKTLTQEFLAPTTLTGLNKRNVWVTFTYIDNVTGLPVTRSTKDHEASALEASTAPWSATTWGPVSTVKRKCEIVTPTAVKQNTPIVVTWFCTRNAPTAEDVFFIDPDFGIN